MIGIKKLLVALVIVIAGGLAASAFTTNDAATVFTAYNTAFLVGGTYPGWWTGAEEIEMAEDAYDNSPTPARQTIVSNACNGFISAHSSIWYDQNNNNYNKFNDDISWAVIAMARGYLITGNTTFRNVAKFNWDAMYGRAWDTNFTGGGLWWNTDNTYKNAAVNGPAAIAACLLYNIYGDSSYLSKATSIYAWERRVLVNTNNGSIADGINLGSSTTSGGPLTYNQGTFIGAANLLYRATGLPIYYQDAILVGKYTQNSMTSGGILPEYGSASDLSGFNGIFARWMARFARDQNLWLAFGPWLTTNADAAWSVRNASNLAWQKWLTSLGTNVLDNWGCSASVVIMQVADPSPADALQVTPAAGFTAVSQPTRPPDVASILLTLTNTGTVTLNWSLANTSAWLNVSSSSGSLPVVGLTSVTVSIVPSATISLPAGRYFANIAVTNLATGVISSRLFTLVISGGDAPVAMAGYNAAVVAANTATSATPNATGFDIPNNYCFYQAGVNGSTRGLPPDGVFTSQWDGLTVFQFKPYGSTNALVLGSTYPSGATLTMVTPQAYKSLSFLAASANGGGLGTFVLNFTNGTHSQAFNFNAQDWFGTTANVGIQGFGRLKLGASFGTEDNGASNPNIYQTTLNLESLGLNLMVASITFTKPASAGTCGIFAISGTAAYRAPVITQQPAPSSLYRLAGSANSWSVAANAALPVSYYWCLNGEALPLATNSTFQLSNLQMTNSGSYMVIVSNRFGAVTSSIVSLTVVRTNYPLGQVVAVDHALGFWRLDETSGTVARDYLSANNGAYTPSVLLGQPGNKLLDTHKAARFGLLASNNSCVTNIAVDFATAGNNSAAFSVEAWVNGGSQATDAGIVTKGYGNGGEQFNLDCGGGSHAFRFFVRNAGGGVHAATSSVVPDNQWHHLVGVCDEISGYVRLYVDGIIVAQGTITNKYYPGILSSAYPVSIGSRQSGSATTYDNQFVGTMEEVAIYGYALSPIQVMAHYLTATNRAPVFLSNPFTVASANAGQPYSASLANNASDPNGDAMMFAKVSGPVWLSIASNGILSGTSGSGDVGTNVFVVSVTDTGGLFSTATMNLEVIAAPPLVAIAALQGGNLLLNWVGGIAPYQVQVTTNLLNPVWQDLGAPVIVNSVLVSPTTPSSFYRIYGQ